VFAAYNFYHLVPQILAFALMIGVTALGFMQGIMFNSLAIGLLAWAGGFLTPILLASTAPNHVGFFSYMVFLDLGLLALVLAKHEWFVLKPLTYVATYLMSFAWYVQYYSSAEHFRLAVFFAVLFWAMFFAVDVYRAAFGTAEEDAPWWKVDSILNSTGSYWALFFLIHDAYPAWMGLVTLLYASMYGGAYTVVFLRKPHYAFAQERYAFTTGFYVVIATGIEYTAPTTLLLWMAEAVILFWASMVRKHIIIRYVGLAVLGFVGIHIMSMISSARAEDFRLILNTRVAVMSAYIFALLLAAMTVRRFRAAFHESERDIVRLLEVGLHAAWNIVLLSLVTIEIALWFDAKTVPLYKQFDDYVVVQDFMQPILNRKELTISIVWLLWAVLAMVLGLRFRRRSVRLGAIVLFGVAILKIFFADLSFLSTPYRIISFIALGVVLLAVSYLYQRFRHVIVGEPPRSFASDAETPAHTPNTDK
jgi:uncharacterized membrane protein